MKELDSSKTSLDKVLENMLQESSYREDCHDLTGHFYSSVCFCQCLIQPQGRGTQRDNVASIEECLTKKNKLTGKVFPRPTQEFGGSHAKDSEKVFLRVDP